MWRIEAMIWRRVKFIATGSSYELKAERNFLKRQSPHQKKLMELEMIPAICKAGMSSLNRSLPTLITSTENTIIRFIGD
jgi:hypothetical protein